jgi:periplasmic protein CpxP/Spy
MKRLTTRTMLSAAVALALVAGVGGASIAAQENGPGRGQRMARPGGPGGPGMSGPGLGLPLRQLDLSEAQREALRGITGTHADAFRAVQERARSARRSLNEAVTGEAFDEAMVRQRAAEVAAVEADAAVLRAQVYQQLFAVLTPEQQQKSRELRAAGDQRLQERGERRQPRRQGSRPGGRG